LKGAVALALLAAPSVATAQVRPSFPAPSFTSTQQLNAQSMLDARIDILGESFNGDIGIAVKDIQTGWTTHFDGTTLFPQQSVSKFWVALTALDRADRDELDLNRRVTIRREDLTLFNQPIAQLVRGDGGYTTTLNDLMQRAIQQSDNTCNDVLLWRSGGPDAVRAFLRSKRVDGIRFGPGERVMQSQLAGLQWQQSYSIGDAFYRARAALPATVRRDSFDRYVADPVDGAMPLSIVDTLARLKKGELLSPASTQRILSIMSNTRTGPQRLKGGLAPGWKLAHKTGTGQQYASMVTGYNDIGIVTAPDGKSYAVAVMIRRTSAPITARMQVMQSVVRSVIAYHAQLAAPDMAGASRTSVSGSTGSR
jgi:beta-lactamase class A